MAFRRSITTRSNLIARRLNPSFSYVTHDDDGKHESVSEVSSHQRLDIFLKGRRFGGHKDTSCVFGGLGTTRYCELYSIPSRMGFDINRHMSTSIGESSEKIDVITDVVGALAETTMETVGSQAAVLSEVAIATADSWYPVTALQYIIDGVHSFSGLNWWASIALTTLLIRGATIPLLINQLRATTKLAIMRPKLDEIQQEMNSKGMMNPEAINEGKRRMNLLFKEYGVTPWTPIKGLFIQGPVFVSFFLGISNMAEKVPSFKHGGAYWFTDLSTPDNLYILPVLAGATFLIQVECNMQEGMEGSPMAGTMKKFLRALAVLTVPFTMSFPKAVFFYWVTSNAFSLMYGQVIKRPGVKKFCGIPDIPPPPPGSTQPSSFSLSALYKQYKETVQRAPIPVESSVEPPKLLMDRKMTSVLAVNHKLRTLEKQVKGRKKNNKR